MEFIIFLIIILIVPFYVMVLSATNIMMIMKYGKDWRDGTDE